MGAKKPQLPPKNFVKPLPPPPPPTTKKRYVTVIVHEFKSDRESTVKEIKNFVKGRGFRLLASGFYEHENVYDYQFTARNEKKALEYVNDCNEHFGRRVTTYAYRDYGLDSRPEIISPAPKSFRRYLDCYYP